MNPRTAAEGIGLAVIAVLSWFAWQKPAPGIVNQPQEAQKAPEVAKTQMVEITPAKVKVYAPEAKQKLRLSQELQKDDAVSVLDSSVIPDSDHPQTVTTVLNSNTGEAQTFVTVDPYPWLAGENEAEVTVSYGIKNAGKRVGRAAIGDDLFQIKALHIGVNGSLDTDGSYFAGVGIKYKF